MTRLPFARLTFFLLLLQTSCSQEAVEYRPDSEAGILAAHFEVELGGVVDVQQAAFAPWTGEEPWAEDVPEILQDRRPSLRVSTPSRIRLKLPASKQVRQLRTAVYCPKREKDLPIRAEVFWEDDAGLQSLGKVDLTSEANAWQDLVVEVPATGGDLIFSTRVSSPGLAERATAAVDWAKPWLQTEARGDAPDILLITLDTMRFDALKHAPYLSNLMGRGESWSRAYSPSNWTLPAYASLMTGLAPEEHGCGRGPFAPEATGSEEDRSFRQLGDSPTLAEALSLAGYATCMLHQNPLLEPWSGLDRGFDRYVRTADRAQAHRRYALEWWGGEMQRPKFLALHYMAPHLPYLPPDSYREGLASNPLEGMSVEDFFGEDRTPDERKEFFQLSAPEQDAVRAWYAAEVRAMDAAIGDLARELRRYSRELWILVHADHGEEHWDAGSFEHGHGFEDCIIHVPLAMVRMPHGPTGSHADPVPAHHLGTYLLEELGIEHALPPSALGSSPDADRRVRSSMPLYRSPTGGRLWDPAEGAWMDLPFDGSGSHGQPGVLDPQTIRHLAEMGY